MNPTRILLVGANGRMGQAISSSITSQPDLVVTDVCQRDDLIEEKMRNVDVVVDVSHPDAAVALSAAAIKNKLPIVIGTTGQSAEQRDAIENAARSVAVVLASNFSVGVNALFALTRVAGEILGDEFKPEIVESHHRMKKDAPSGTAKSIAEILRKQQKTSAEIPIQSIREGNLVGEHIVIFAGPGERLELTHRAESREIFALGALRAARWVVGQPAGLYSMQDVLGLKPER